MTKRQRFAWVALIFCVGTLGIILAPKRQRLHPVNYIRIETEINEGAWSIQGFNKAPIDAGKLTVTMGLLRNDGTTSTVVFPVGRVISSKSFIIAGFDTTVTAVRVFKVESK